jgi:hypothetical protein
MQNKLIEEKYYLLKHFAFSVPKPTMTERHKVHKLKSIITAAIIGRCLRIWECSDRKY